MQIHSYNRHDTFAVTLNELSGSNIITIWEPKADPIELDNLPTIQRVIKNGWVNSLRIMTKVISIAEVDLPTLTVEQSRTERLGIVRTTEWQSERKHLNLHLRLNANDWVKIGTVSILNIPPFHIYDLVEYFTKDVAIPLGGYSAIGMSIENAGYGLLTGSDIIVVSGFATTEVVVIPQEIANISETFNYGATITNQSVVFIPEILNKKQVTLTNLGNADIFLSIGKPAEINKGVGLKANGGSYEFNRSNHPFNGALHAICDGSSLLTGMVAI